jgi:16S rRNA processing protein RimM
LSSSSSRLEVGRIEKVHGLRGEVVVSLTSNMVEARTAVGSELHAGDRVLTVASARPHGLRWLIRFEGFTDRDGAEALRGQLLHGDPLPIERGDPGPRTEAHDHGTEVVAFIHDLIGRRLRDQHGQDHGRITSVFDNPASDVLELEGGGLVPLTFFRGIDADTEMVLVDVPEGLLDDGAVPADPQP